MELSYISSLRRMTNSMKLKPHIILKNNFLEFLFLVVTALFIFFSTKEKFQRESITYTYLHFVVLAFSSIQTFFAIHDLATFAKKFNRVLRKVDFQFRRLGFCKEKMKPLSPKTLKVLGCLILVFFSKVILFALSTDSTIFHRMYSIICYTGQKLTEFCLLFFIRKLQEMIMKNYSGFHSAAKLSGKFIILL